MQDVIKQMETLNSETGSKLGCLYHVYIKRVSQRSRSVDNDFSDNYR